MIDPQIDWQIGSELEIIDLIDALLASIRQVDRYLDQV